MKQSANERKFYMIHAYTGTGENDTVYLSTKSEENVKTTGQDMVNELAYYCAMERFWHEAFEDETEDEFLERYLERCGFVAEEITPEEYKAQNHKVWSMS